MIWRIDRVHCFLLLSVIPPCLRRYAFVALNTLQGLFIFLAFTCTEKVIRGLCEALPCLGRTLGRARAGDGKPIRPPSFSWSGSGGSADSTHKSALGSSSESSSPSQRGLGLGLAAANGHGHSLNGGHHGLSGSHRGINGSHRGINGSHHGLNGHNSVRHQEYRHNHASSPRDTSDTLY